MNWVDDEEEEIENKEKDENKEEEKDEDSGDERRVVKTPKEKLKDMIKDNYKKIKKEKEKGNYMAISESFDILCKHIDKITSTFKKEETPILFNESLIMIEDISNMTKDEQKSAKRDQIGWINSIKRSFNKHIKKCENLFKDYKQHRASEEDIQKEENQQSKKLKSPRK